MSKIKSPLIKGLLGVLFLNLFCCSPPESDLKVSSTTTNHKYVDEKACIQCHAAEVKQWSESHHAKAMLPMNDSTVSGSFNGQILTFAEKKWSFFKKENRFFVFTDDLKSEGDTLEIIHTFGFTPLQQYLVAFPNGKIQALRIAWDTQENQWYDLYSNQKIIPEDWLHWTRSGMNWNTMCAECHTTNYRKNYDASNDQYHSQYDEVGVTCISCHGNAAIHVESMNKGESSLPGAVLVNSKTSHQQLARTCATCHSRKTNLTDSISFYGNMSDFFIPEILSDGLYHGDGQISDEVYVYGSFIQSKMYHNGVKCSDCHNSHSLKLKKEGNDLCLQCHKPSYSSENHSHHTSAEAQLCISCHMTGKNYMGIDFRRDHSFRIPRPDQSSKYGTPNACNECHTDKNASWAEESINHWYGTKRAYHFSDDLLEGRNRNTAAVDALGSLLNNKVQPEIARATAAYYLGEIPTKKSVDYLIKALLDTSSLIRHYSVKALFRLPAQEKYVAVLPLLRDPSLAVRMMAAELLTDIPKEQFPSNNISEFLKAQNEWKKSMESRLDFPGGNMQLATYYYRISDTNNALFYFQRALKMDTMLHDARENLARIYSQLNRLPEAQKELDITLSLDAKNWQAYYSKALLFVQEGALPLAEKAFGQSLTINPNQERGWYNFGLFYEQQNNLMLSLNQVNKGLIHFPTSALLIESKKRIIAKQQALKH